MKLLLAAPGVFVAESSYEERAAPKAAGFRWHGGGCYKPANCAACLAKLGKLWWSDKTECAARLVEFATPEAREALGAHVAAVETSKAVDADIEIPAPAGLSYLPYQRGGIAYALARESTLIGDEMGLGKTIQALGFINAEPSIKSALIVCPAALRVNWLREATKWLVRPMRIAIIDDEHPLPDPEAEIVIVNYDRARKPEVHAALMARDWDLLVVDEAHRVKNPKAAQTIAVLGGKKPKAKASK